MAAYYLDLGAWVNGSTHSPSDAEIRPLICSCKNGHLGVVKLLLDRNVDTSRPALEVAARHGHYAIVRILLDHGAELGEAISEAVAKGYRDIVEILLDHGTDPNNGSRSSLVSAIKHEHEAMFQLLVKKGGESIHPDTCLTCVKVAKEEGLESMLELLREYDMDVDSIV